MGKIIRLAPFNVVIYTQEAVISYKGLIRTRIGYYYVWITYIKSKINLFKCVHKFFVLVVPTVTYFKIFWREKNPTFEKCFHFPMACLLMLIFHLLYMLCNHTTLFSKNGKIVG